MRGPTVHVEKRRREIVQQHRPAELKLERYWVL
ncbi:hypothetical protein T211_01975 [Lactococcus lactis subsp. lactis bv. diacetylactis str. LD61]|nr:hypothetical protein LLDT4_12125 [Lactococcus lactis subsp. lactis bv. diacetylactis str. TIFN4]EQC92110.1 hypothetical protein LLDT2_11070 [Lactococcus lactis subsp. lactis bv. diacetylactis str. TIFN2]ESK80275.1 hypothetical protein T211_01975 [Lactococcus lactis subsp. lactis bv. diacetylactis str. LD61]KHE77189.1 hypothetical protein N489_05330 [Lactococcus lactis subsp. lactis 1AA59]OAZ16890.1 hypothetical protein V425_05515 [Lactococcus lactis RTB018]